MSRYPSLGDRPRRTARRPSPSSLWIGLALLIAVLAVVEVGLYGAPHRTPVNTPAPAPAATSAPLAESAPTGSAAGATPPPRRSIVFPTSAAKATATPAVAASPDGSSEGVRLTGASRWHDAGFTGKGVKVGVIEWTFNQTEEYLAGARFTVHSFRPDGATVITDEAQLPYGQLHGTATAAIVHEMAPDAELVLAVITQDPASFVIAMDWLTQTAKVNVVSMSGGWYAGYAKDGTSPLARAVDRAKAAGVFVALSGGNKGGGQFGSNDAEGHFRVPFTDTDGDGYHDFPPVNGKILNAETIRVGAAILRLSVDWEGYRNPQAEYRVELADASGNRVAWTDPARTTDTNAPYAQLTVSLPRGAYALRIRKETPDAPDLPVEIFFNGAQFPEVMPEGSLNIPADARGAVAVGPANWQSDAIEAFASQGPTRDGRTKPDIYGPDCTTSGVYSTYGGQFCGASAATPHVAGAAALVKDAFPDASPDDILRWLTTYGKPIAGGAVRVDLGPVPPHP